MSSIGAANDDDDDGAVEQHIAIGNPNEEDYTWLPIHSQQDGQGMFLPSLSPTPPASPIPMASTQLPQCEWTTVIHEYEALLTNKASMDRRKFNKSISRLLDKTMVLAKQHLQQINLTVKQDPLIQWQNAEEAFSKYRKELLNPKEMKSEELVEQVVAYVNSSMPAFLTADERKEELQKKSLSLLQDLSPQMSIKLAPILKSYISRLFGCALDDMLAEVCLPELSLKDKTSMYTRMINNFLDDVSCLSFALSNRRLLGNIAPVDLWFLTFFAFVTVRRSRGDNLLMLGCVGELIISF